MHRALLRYVSVTIEKWRMINQDQFNSTGKLICFSTRTELQIEAHHNSMELQKLNSNRT